MKKFMVILILVLVSATGAVAQFSETPVEFSTYYPEILIAARMGDLHAIEEFYNAGIYVDEADCYWGRTALMEAASVGNTETVAYLLGLGASADRADRYGKTPLMFAAACGNCESVAALLDSGANIEMVCAEGLHAYEHAIAAGNKDAAELIAEVSMP
jgi:ankyrin repeat protein